MYLYIYKKGLGKVRVFLFFWLVLDCDGSGL